MDDELVAHALSLILDDPRIGEWVTAEADKRLGRKGPEDVEFWKAHAIATNELINAVLARNEAD